MNRAFSEYSASTAFAVILSKNQCNALLRVDELGDQHAHEAMLTVGTLQPLERRGLVFWHRDDQGRPNGFRGLTNAGILMVALLREAGLTVANTNTIGMLNRMERHGVSA